MTIKHHNPKTVALAGKYSLGAEVAAGARLVYVSGQVGLDSKGKLGAGIEKQVELAWKNIGQVLKSAGMGYKDIVKINGYITDSRFLTAYREGRGKFIGEPYPASTLVVVSGLADPGMLVEIEVVAAK
jgi:enamine deaminase RidA (YjgF/YER057c/UK114 family)